MTITLAQLAESFRTLKDQLGRKLGLAGVSDASLHTFLGRAKGLSESTIRQVLDGTYKAADLSKLKLTFDHAAKVCRMKYGIAGSWGANGEGLHDTPEWARLQTAIKVATSNSLKDKNRKLIFFLGHPGFGKTTNISRMLTKYSTAEDWQLAEIGHAKATVGKKEDLEKRLQEIDLSAKNGQIPAICTAISARGSWKNSYFAALKAFCLACGVTGETASESRAEEKLFAHLSSERHQAGFRPRILCVDEVEYCGKQVVDLWKLLLSETPLILVVFCQPAFFADFHKMGGIHTDQLLQRCVDVIRVDEVTAQAARPYLAAARGEYDGLDADAASLANYANGRDCQGLDQRNKGGGYRLCSEAALLMAAAEKMTLEDAVAAFRHAQGIQDASRIRQAS